MYKIIGADGREYGPVTIDQLQDWLAQRRISAKTQIQIAGGTEWKPADQIPELASFFADRPASITGGGPPPLPSRVRPSIPQTGMAVASFVLGLCSFGLCLTALTGIPAIICGHIARRRAIRFPARYGGRGFATTGMLLGYASLIFLAIIASLVLPAISKMPRTKAIPQLSDCENNLRQIGLSFKVWELEHNDQFPFNVSTNAGGTLELCGTGPDGFDKNAIAHFLVISNELGTPALLVCPNDRSKHPAERFQNLHSDNVSYRLRTGTNINSENPHEVLALCPVHGNQLFCDGNVRKTPRH